MTLQQLNQLIDDSDLRARVRIGIAVLAQNIRAGAESTPDLQRMALAIRTREEAEKFMVPMMSGLALLPAAESLRTDYASPDQDQTPNDAVTDATLITAIAAVAAAEAVRF